MSELNVFLLALDICLDLESPWFEKHPKLAECPDVDAVYFELLLYLLAEAA